MDFKIRRFASGAILASVMALACLEISGLAAAFLAPGLFQRRAAIVRAIDQIEESSFRSFASAARPPQVWDAAPNSTYEMRSCMGQTQVATYDDSGARRYPGYDRASATVLLIGDSYTHGDEVGDESTISAHLFRQTRIVSANLGVGNYSNVQALLKAKQVWTSFPKANTIVLGVMYENIRRNLNSYFPVFINEPSSIFALRPYVSNGAIRLVPPEVFSDLDAMRAYARSRLDADFWRLPEPRFPYSRTLFRMASSEHFQIRNKSRAFAVLGHQYRPDYVHDELADGLTTVVRKFLDWSASLQLRGIVVFIPQNGLDRSSPHWWRKRFEASYGPQRSIFLPAMDDVDWRRYNLKANGDCHPSDYGYGMIAREYARSIATLQASQ